MRKSYTVTTYTASALRRVGRDLVCPFSIVLEGDVGTIQCLQVLRFLPGKRIVCRARWRQQTLLVKLILSRFKASLHAQRERAGMAAMAAASCRVPALVLDGHFGRGRVLGFEFLPDATTMAEQWDGWEWAERSHWMTESLDQIARLHGAGLTQNDIHPGNFLVDNQHIYCIDGDGINRRHRGSLLSDRRRRDNLALYFAQSPPQHDARVPDWLTTYNAAYQRISSGHDLAVAEMLDAVRKWRNWRLDNYLDKVYRDSSAFVCNRNWRHLTLFDRRLESPHWRQYLQQLDRHLEAGQRLKSGNTATVALSEFRDRTQCRQVVIKRYNIKGFRHWLGRFWRPSRGWVSWGNGHMLGLLGIDTPRPLALVEERFGPLRGRAFLVCEYSKGESVLARYHRQDRPGRIPKPELALFRQLFETLIAYRITHGDMKANNLLLQAGRLQVIDLDIMCRHRSGIRFRRAFARDLRRFEKNWQDLPAVGQSFAGIIKPLLTSLSKAREPGRG